MKNVLDDLTTVAQKILVKRKFTCFYLEVHSLTIKKQVKLHTQENILLESLLSNYVSGHLTCDFDSNISINISIKISIKMFC